MFLNFRLKKIMKEYGYTGHILRETLADIKACDKEIYRAISRFVNEGIEENIIVEPCEYENVKEAYKMTPIAAYLFMDLLKKEPEKALRQIGLGFDSIELPEDSKIDEAEDERNCDKFCDDAEDFEL